MKRYFYLLGLLFCLLSCERKQDVIANIRFAVSDSSFVTFSKGNLQYQASSATWRFADKQYEVIGEGNENVAEGYDGWIDLFGWGTSGYNNRMPYMVLDSELGYSATTALYYNGFAVRLVKDVQ